MTLLMLDTNIVSHIVRGDRPDILQRLTTVPMESLTISAVTQGELRYGLARRGHPPRLSELVRQVLLRVEVLPWGSEAAEAYGDLRAACEASGLTVAPLDQMIAGHAVAADAILVTRDGVFRRIPPPLRVETWDEAQP